MVHYRRHLINLINFSIEQEMVENLKAVRWSEDLAHGEK